VLVSESAARCDSGRKDSTCSSICLVSIVKQVVPVLILPAASFAVAPLSAALSASIIVCVIGRNGDTAAAAAAAAAAQYGLTLILLDDTSCFLLLLEIPWLGVVLLHNVASAVKVETLAGSRTLVGVQHVLAQLDAKDITGYYCRRV
jgi:hypothetical protein